MNLVYERRGSGEPLVLLHAFGLTWKTWEPVLDLLAAHRDVIAVDLPGFGASPSLPRGTRYTIPGLCDVLEEFFVGLKLNRPHVAGNSLGGLITLELACRASVRTATAIAPPGFYTVAGGARTAAMILPAMLAVKLPAGVHERALRSRRISRIACAAMTARPGVLTDAMLLEYVAALRGSSAALPLALGIRRHAFFRGRPQVPLTLVWPSRDRIIAHRQGLRAARMLPDARHITLPNCGHIPMYDDPYRVTAAILKGSAPASTTRPLSARLMNRTPELPA